MTNGQLDILIVLGIALLFLLPSIGGLIAILGQRSKCQKCGEVFPSIESKCFHQVYMCRDKEADRGA